MAFVLSLIEAMEGHKTSGADEMYPVQMSHMQSETSFKNEGFLFYMCMIFSFIGALSLAAMNFYMCGDILKKIGRRTRSIEMMES